LGKNIRNARNRAGLTQKALADSLQVRQKDISRWENNEYVPNALTFRNICKAIGVSADEVLELTV